MLIMQTAAFRLQANLDVAFAIRAGMMPMGREGPAMLFVQMVLI